MADLLDVTQAQRLNSLTGQKFSSVKGKTAQTQAEADASETVTEVRAALESAALSAPQAAQDAAGTGSTQSQIMLSRNTDLVEISDQAKAALAAAKSGAGAAPAQAQQAAETAQGAQTTSGDQSLTQVKAQAALDSAQLSGTQEAEETADTEDTEALSSSSSASTNLSTLTEEQIDKLVSDGAITQAEARTELMRRAAAQKAAEQAQAPDPAEEAGGKTQAQTIGAYRQIQDSVITPQAQSGALFSAVA